MNAMTPDHTAGRRSAAGLGSTLGIRPPPRRLPGALLGLALLAPALAHAQSTLPPNPDAAGLWIGEVRLHSVSGVSQTTAQPTPHQAEMRMIVHVDATGKPRLLKDVILARKQSATGLEVALVTDPARLSSLPLATDGATPRIAGQRFSTVAYDFTDNDADPTDHALELDGGVGIGFECRGVLELPKDHVTNPFRHKYHPDHANEGPNGFEVSRVLRFHSFTPMADENGVPQIGCSYEEKVTGLIRAEITVQGNVVLRRVSTTPVLNQ